MVPFFETQQIEGSDRYDRWASGAAIRHIQSIEANNFRLQAAEALTNGDSGLIGFAAASASTQDEQSRLYTHLATATLEMQEDKTLLQEWLQAQQTGEFIEPGTSAAIFFEYDGDRVLGEISEAGITETEAVNSAIVDRLYSVSKLSDQALFVYKIVNTPDDTRTVTIDFEATQELWHGKEAEGDKEAQEGRIAELKKAIQENELKPHHLRWIEALSHLVDQAGLATIIKQRGVEREPTQLPPTFTSNLRLRGLNLKTVDDLTPEFITQLIEENRGSLEPLLNQIFASLPPGGYAELSQEFKDAIPAELRTRFDEEYGGGSENSS